MRNVFQKLFQSAGRSAALALAAAFLQMPYASALAEDDPPARIARLNHIDGTVSFSPAGTDDWSNATANRPLTIGDRVWADKGARSELHVGANTLRLGGSTSMEILDLNDQDMQLKVTQGRLSLRVRDLDRDEIIEIDTPNLAFVIKEPGEYRFDVDPDRDTTTVIVRRGSGVAYGSDSDNRSVPMKNDRQLTFSGDDLFYSVSTSAPPRDAFDRWTAQRDDREDNARSLRYVSRDMTGYEDLDDNGEWRETRDYGPVWVPRVTLSNWAPYHHGHWAWVAPWGWTWIDDEPWGFAPFHYGRWAHIDDHWAWVPGPISRRPVYAPALVGFVGGDGNGSSRWSVSISVGQPGIAWFALAPGEHYRPAYTSNPRYITNINRTIVVRQTVVIHRDRDVYINQRKPHAIAVMPARDFVNGRGAHEHRQQVHQDRLRDFARMPSASSLPVAPVRQSIVGSSRPTQAVPSDRIHDHKVVARRQAPEPPVFRDKLARRFANDEGAVRGAGPVFTPTQRPIRDALVSGAESRDGGMDRRPASNERTRPDPRRDRDAPREPSVSDRSPAQGAIKPDIASPDAGKRDERREERREEQRRDDPRPEVSRPPSRANEPQREIRQRGRDHGDAARESTPEVAVPPMREPRREPIRLERNQDIDRSRAESAERARSEELKRGNWQRPERPAVQSPVLVPPVQQAPPAARVELPQQTERKAEPRQEVPRQEAREERRQERREERRDESRAQPRPEVRPELRPELRQERKSDPHETRPAEERRIQPAPRDDDGRRKPQDGERRQHRKDL